MFVPHGAPASEKVPSTPVVTLISGEPLTSDAHESHETPAVNGVTPYVGAPAVPFGMYTSAP